MLPSFRLALLALLLGTGSLCTSAYALCAQSICPPDGTQASGAKYRICMPEPGCWNGDLVLYAHGYVDFTKPIAIPEDQLGTGGISIPGVINQLGHAFAASSYSVNGLAVQQGIADTADLITIFRNLNGAPRKVFLVGPSEGGIITALSVERFPNLYAAGLAACGPVGDWPAQINYFGNFRGLFDYFFPGVIPGPPTQIPSQVITDWDSVYVPAIRAAYQAKPLNTFQLMNVNGTPGFLDPNNRDESVIGVLWYSTFATNDGVQKLNGQPFDNSRKVYSGSFNDARLNAMIPRYTADPSAVQTMQQQYQTTGNITIPLVTMHTLGDQIIPYWHEPLYRQKIAANGKTGLHINIPVNRYGHCNFNAAEIVIGFLLMVQKAGGAMPVNAEMVLKNASDRTQFRELARQYGLQ